MQNGHDHELGTLPVQMEAKSSPVVDQITEHLKAQLNDLN